MYHIIGNCVSLFFKNQQVTKVDLCIIFFYFDETNEINITFKAKKHTFKNTLIIAFA